MRVYKLSLLILIGFSIAEPDIKVYQLVPFLENPGNLYPIWSDGYPLETILRFTSGLILARQYCLVRKPTSGIILMKKKPPEIQQDGQQEGQTEIQQEIQQEGQTEIQQENQQENRIGERETPEPPLGWHVNCEDNSKCETNSRGEIYCV